MANGETVTIGGNSGGPTCCVAQFQPGKLDMVDVLETRKQCTFLVPGHEKKVHLEAIVAEKNNLINKAKQRIALAGHGLPLSALNGKAIAPIVTISTGTFPNMSSMLMWPYPLNFGTL